MATIPTTGPRHRPPAYDAPHRGEMVRALFAKSIADRLTLAAIVGALMIAMGAFVGALWPPLRDTFAGLPAGFVDAIAKAFPGGDLTSGIGFVNTELMSVVAPAGAIAVAVISASRATAGEEEDKTLGVLLAAPVSRLTFLFTKTGAMISHVLVVGVLLAVGLVVGNAIGNLGLTAGGIFGAVTHTAALGILFGVVATLIATATGNRRLATAGTGALAALAFVLSALLPLADAVSGGAKISPWYYFNAANPLVNGPDAGHLIILAGAAAVPMALAAVVFHTRDLRG